MIFKKKEVKVMKKFLVLILLVFAVGCAKKHVKTSGELGAGEGMEEEVVTEKISPEDMPEADMSEVEGTLFKFKDALFDFDRYNIRPDARDVLDDVSVWLNNHKYTNILIEGHCDERGTNEYNLALGEKRAKAARDYLISRGIGHKRINVITYGEEQPVCISHNETCWQKNRRAHFIVTK